MSNSVTELVQAAQAGCSADLNALLARVRPMVCRWAVVWTGSPDAAEDIAQTVRGRIEGAFKRLSGPIPEVTRCGSRIL
jgi:DNA-directed RNA polymerase specialized sigma24 family protein